MERWKSIEFYGEKKGRQKIKETEIKKENRASKIVAKVQYIYCPFDQVIDLLSKFTQEHYWYRLVKIFIRLV